MKVERYLAAVINCRDRYLIIRPSPSEIGQAVPFFFPGCKKSKFYDDKVYLQAQMDSKYALALRVRDFMGKSVVVKGHVKTEVYAYYCELRIQIQFDRKEIDYRFVNADDILSFNMDENDKEIATRLHYFKRVYDYALPSTYTSPAEDKELAYYVDSLNYFGKAIEDKDREDMFNLIVSHAPIKLVRGAYLWILNRNKLDYNEYLQALDKERAKYAKKHKKDK